MVFLNQLISGGTTGLGVRGDDVGICFPEFDVNVSFFLVCFNLMMGDVDVVVVDDDDDDDDDHSCIFFLPDV